METIKFDDSTCLYLTHYDISDFKDEALEICKTIIESGTDVKYDGYYFYFGKVETDNQVEIKTKNKLEVVRNFATNKCIDLFDVSGKPHNIVYMECWINVVRAKNPKQKNYTQNTGDLIFHNHVEINKMNKKPSPNYTFVYYIQMPDNLLNDEGVLFVKGENEQIFSYLPKEGDIVIMKGDIPHVPNSSPNSTKDRIVLAGNICIEYSKLKNSLI
jgi:hypothetical protein